MSQTCSSRAPKTDVVNTHFASRSERRRGRLMQQMLIESGVLAALGCVAGFALTFAGISLFRAMTDNSTLTERLRVDWRVLTFTLVTSALTAFIFGIVPAWQASRTDPNVALRESERGSVGKSRALVRQGLAVAEISLAMVLLVGAGLMINTVLRLSAVDPGFDPRNVLIVDINLPEGDKYVERLTGGGMEKWTPAVDRLPPESSAKAGHNSRCRSRC